MRPAPKIVIKFGTRDPKDWQPLHNYIQQNDLFITSKKKKKKPDY